MADCGACAGKGWVWVHDDGRRRKVDCPICTERQGLPRMGRDRRRPGMDGRRRSRSAGAARRMGPRGGWGPVTRAG